MLAFQQVKPVLRSVRHRLAMPMTWNACATSCSHQMSAACLLLMQAAVHAQVPRRVASTSRSCYVEHVRVQRSVGSTGQNSLSGSAITAAMYHHGKIEGSRPPPPDLGKLHPRIPDVVHFSGTLLRQIRNSRFQRASSIRALQPLQLVARSLYKKIFSMPAVDCQSNCVVRWRLAAS